MVPVEIMCNVCLVDDHKSMRTRTCTTIVEKAAGTAHVVAAGVGQAAGDVQIAEGLSKISGTVYFAGAELRALLDSSYATFAHTNPLHGDVFPSVRRMEAEVVSMVAAMLGGELFPTSTSLARCAFSCCHAPYMS